MANYFSEELLSHKASKEKADARKVGKVRGFGAVVQNLEELPSSEQMINSGIAVINSVSESQKTSTDTLVETEQPALTVATGVTAADIRELINSALQPFQQQNTALSQENESLRNQLNDLNTQQSQAANEINQLRGELQTTAQQRDNYASDSRVLHDVGRLTGVNVVNVNTRTSVNDSPKGDVEELINILNDQIRSKTHKNIGGHSPTTGQLYLNQRDPRSAGLFIQESFKEAADKGRGWRDSGVVKSTEAWLKSNGLLKGEAVTNAAGPTTGGSASVPNAFLDVLSAIMRETHSQSNIFWQFTITAFDSSSAPGKNILVPRFNFLPQPQNLSDFLIADTTTYNPIGLTIGNSTDSQNLEMTTLPIACFQWGIGRGTSVGTRPVFIPEFHEALSLVNLLDAVDSRLAQNYYAFEDLQIRTEYQRATTIVYNAFDNITTTPTDVTTGGVGTMTRQFLTSVYTQMYGQQMPTYPDGCYALAINPSAAGQLKRSFDNVMALPDREQIERVSNMFRQVSGFDFGRVNNYLGMFENFHVFLGNSFGVGLPGSSPTVQNTTFGTGVGLRPTNDSFAFGPGCVGRGIALPMDIRSQGAPFDLGSAYIWVERSGTAPMDLDSTLVPGAQTRCWRLRTARTAI